MLSYLRTRLGILLGVYNEEVFRVLKAASDWKHAGENKKCFREAAAEYKEAENELAEAVIDFEAKFGRFDEE